MSSMYKVALNPQTLFLLSTSGSLSSIEKHNKALQTMGINLAYFTFSYLINAELYAGLLKSPIVRGAAVTGQGLKSAIITHLDDVDQLAKATSSVNTVVNKEGKLYGYNTDSFGFESALRKHIETSGLSIKKAIIYGNGGVSGTAAHVLKSMGITVTMTGRNQAKVTAKMEQLGLSALEGPYDLVVNATPVSSEKIENAIGLKEILVGCKAVFDHNMPEKDGSNNYLQQYCQTNDIYFIPGHDMYTAQMVKQWRLFLDNYTDGTGKHWSVSDEDIIKYWSL